MKRLTCLLLLAAVPTVVWATPGLANSKSASLTSATVAYAEYGTLMSRDANSPINIRDGANTRAYARHIGYAGDRVEIVDRMVGDDGYMWFLVRFTVSNATGWVRGDFISLDQDNWY